MNHTIPHDAKARLQPVIIAALRKHRLNYRLSQAKMSQLLGISVRSYIDLEHGDSFPSAVTLIEFLFLLEGKELSKLLAEMRSALQ